ncbi:MAG: hypothetical protein WKF94_06920 [Solirubrobacteraceae bacterium]
MTFTQVVRWLDDRLSRPVKVTVAGPPESRGNSGAVLEGALAPGYRDQAMIDPRGGTLRQWSVGRSAGFHLLEGDYLSAELEDGILWIETRELQINVAELSD